MKFCHSLLTHTLDQRSVSDVENLIWLSATSVQCLHNHKQKVCLYADKLGHELTKSIPYDERVEIKADPWIPSDCYAASKFYALRLMNPEDIHIDNDVFIDSKLAIDMLVNSNAVILTQLIYKRGLLKFESSVRAHYYLSNLGLIKPDHNEFAFNAGILAIRDIKIKNRYINEYFNFLKLNYNVLKQFDRTTIILDSYNEECRLSNICNELNLPVYSLLGMIDRNGYDEQLQSMADHYKYEHLCGPKYAFMLKVREQLFTMNRVLHDDVYDYCKSLTKLLVKELVPELHEVFTTDTAPELPMSIGMGKPVDEKLSAIPNPPDAGGSDSESIDTES